MYIKENNHFRTETSVIAAKLRNFYDCCIIFPTKFTKIMNFSVIFLQNPCKITIFKSKITYFIKDLKVLSLQFMV